METEHETRMTLIRVMLDAAKRCAAAEPETLTLSAVCATPGAGESAAIAPMNGAGYLAVVVRLHKELVERHGMHTDEVRGLWFPILNQ